jgi:O-acetyl-ADP-ribose deacetylase (regulator of RNase III)
MGIELCIPNKREFDIASPIFTTNPNFSVENKSITEASYSCIASAGNSFAGMSGGVDGIINTHLSAFSEGYVQEFVKKTIVEKFKGELPVGSAVSVYTLHPRHKVLIYAPTMRIPESLPKDTIAPYLAFRAVLVEAERLGIDGVSVPLFGTGAGEVPVDLACRQMLRAYESIERIPRLMSQRNELFSMRKDHSELMAL